MLMPRRLKGVSALALALLPALAGALGLGGIRGDSALNEPFLARIELNGVAPEELDGVKVILASEAEFTKAGSPRSDFLTGLVFVPEVSPEGKVQVRVTSTKPIREPYLDFLVEVTWPKGRLVKGYTVLLDPPTTLNRPAPKVAPPKASAPGPASAAAPIGPASVPPVSSSTPAAPTAGPASPAPTAQTPGPASPAPTSPRAGSPGLAAVPAPVPNLPPPAGYPLRYGPVPAGGNLTSVARRMAPEGASQAQTALGIYRANPQAFGGGNINKIKAGARLEIPHPHLIFAFDAQTAKQQYQAAQRGQPLPPLPALMPGEASGPGLEPSRDRLEIARREPEPAGAGQAIAQAPVSASPTAGTPAATPPPATPNASLPPALGPELALVEREILLVREMAETGRQETADLRGRISRLEDHLADIKRLLELSNAQLAQLQSAGARGEPAAPGASDRMPRPPGAIDRTPRPPGTSSAAQATDALTPSPLAGEGWGEGAEGSPPAQDPAVGRRDRLPAPSPEPGSPAPTQVPEQQLAALVEAPGVSPLNQAPPAATSSSPGAGQTPAPGSDQAGTETPVRVAGAETPVIAGQSPAGSASAPLPVEPKPEVPPKSDASARPESQPAPEPASKKSPPPRLAQEPPPPEPSLLDDLGSWALVAGGPLLILLLGLLFLVRRQNQAKEAAGVAEETPAESPPAPNLSPAPEAGPPNRFSALITQARGWAAQAAQVASRSKAPEALPPPSREAPGPTAVAVTEGGAALGKEAVALVELPPASARELEREDSKPNRLLAMITKVRAWAAQATRKSQRPEAEPPAFASLLKPAPEPVMPPSSAFLTPAQGSFQAPPLAAGPGSTPAPGPTAAAAPGMAAASVVAAITPREEPEKSQPLAPKSLAVPAIAAKEVLAEAVAKAGTTAGIGVETAVGPGTGAGAGTGAGTHVGARIGTAAAAGMGAGATAGIAAAVEAEQAAETGESLTLATPGATPLAAPPAAPARPESPDLDLSLELSLEALAQPSPSAPAQPREEPYELDLSDLEGWDLGVSLTPEPPPPAPTAPAHPEAPDLMTPTLGNLVLAPPAFGSEPEPEPEPVLDLTAGDFDLDLESLVKQEMAPGPTQESPPGEPLEDLDLDLDDLMDLDLSAFTRADTPAGQPQAAPSQALPDWGALGIELEPEEPPPEEHPGSVPDHDFPADFTLDTGHWDEVGIKLDLARAYLQMDDPEAARAILVEAIAEGTGDQIAEAKAMLARLE